MVETLPLALRLLPTVTINQIGMFAFRSKRFWLPRGSAVTFGPDGYPVDPESPIGAYLPTRPVPFEAISHYPVLGLLGEPGMGKTSVMGALAASTAKIGHRVFHRNLGEYSSEAALTNLVKEAEKLSGSASDGNLHIFLDGLDDGLRHFTSFVDALKRLLRQLSPSRVLLRIACRPAEWPSDLDPYFEEVFGNIAVYQLVPLRRVDVREVAQAEGVPGDAFLRSVDVVRVAAFAIRPITLEFLLNIYRQGQPPALQVRIRGAPVQHAMRSLYQQRPQVPIAFLGDPQLRLALARFAALGPQSHVTTDVPTLSEPVRIFHR